MIVGGGLTGLTLASALGESLCPHRHSENNILISHFFGFGTIASSPLIAASHKITLLEASPLHKIESWELGPEEYSNRVSSITAENVAFFDRESSSVPLSFITLEFAY